MNIKLTIQVDEDNQLWLNQDEQNILVVTSKDAAKILKVTRRQIYRYLDKKLLKVYGKLCGDWLIDYASIVALSRHQMTAQPPPQFLQYLFPEYDIRALNVGKDATVIMTRIFEHGSVADIKWLLKRYKRRALVDCLTSHGGRLLSRKTRRLWCLVFRVPEQTSWRDEANPWEKNNEVA